MQNTGNLIWQNSMQISDSFNCYSAKLSIECETHESEVGNTKHMHLHQPRTFP